MTEIGIALAAVFLALIIGTAIARIVTRDGHGHRPAPRGTDDWSAGTLPSRPYGT